MAMKWVPQMPQAATKPAAVSHAKKVRPCAARMRISMWVKVAQASRQMTAATSTRRRSCCVTTQPRILNIRSREKGNLQRNLYGVVLKNWVNFARCAPLAFGARAWEGVKFQQVIAGLIGAAGLEIRGPYLAGFSAVMAIWPSAASSLGKAVDPAGNWFT